MISYLFTWTNIVQSTKYPLKNLYHLRKEETFHFIEYIKLKQNMALFGIIIVMILMPKAMSIPTMIIWDVAKYIDQDTGKKNEILRETNLNIPQQHNISNKCDNNYNPQHDSSTHCLNNDNNCKPCNDKINNCDNEHNKKEQLFPVYCPYPAMGNPYFNDGLPPNAYNMVQKRSTYNDYNDYIEYPLTTTTKQPTLPSAHSYVSNNHYNEPRNNLISYNGYSSNFQLPQHYYNFQQFAGTNLGVNTNNSNFNYTIHPLNIYPNMVNNVNNINPCFLQYTRNHNYNQYNNNATVGVNSIQINAVL